MPARLRARGCALLLGLLLLAGCAQQYQDNWHLLHTGMTKDQVEALLGKPSSTYVSPVTQEADGGSLARARERWQYGDTLSSLGTRVIFPDEADQRTWRVFFGADGRVIEFERP